MGYTIREVEQPWSDCNNQVTTHYEVYLWFDVSHKPAAADIVDVFPVLDASAYVTETGINMTALDYRNPAKIAALHADYLANFFAGLAVGDASQTARAAGAKAKQYIKKKWKQAIALYQ